MKRTIIICVLVSLIPIGISGGGIYWAVKKNARFEKYKKVKGEIIELAEKRSMFDKDQDVVYYPRIRYYDANEEEHEFQLKTGSRRPLGNVSEKVDLLVNPEDPDDVVIDSFTHKWLGPTVVLIIGVIILTFVSIVSVRVIINEHKGYHER